MRMLPYPEKPVFLCYHNKAFPFGIIQANAKGDFMRWLCSKSVGCIFNPSAGDDKFDLDIVDQWGKKEKITSEQTLALNKGFIDSIGLDLNSVITKAIDSDCYVKGIFNEKYIPRKQAYGLYDFIHDFLIIGYNDQCYYSVGYVDDGHFRCFEIPFQNFIDAICNTEDSLTHVEFLRYNTDVTLNPNNQWMISELEKYVSNTEYGPADCPRFGLAAITSLKDMFWDEVVNNKRAYIDRRFAMVFYEHEWVLNQIVNLFLCDVEKERYSPYTVSNLNKAHIIRLLGLKMMATKQERIINNVILHLNEVIQSEKYYIPLLINQLKKELF